MKIMFLFAYGNMVFVDLKLIDGLVVFDVRMVFVFCYFMDHLIPNSIEEIHMSLKPVPSI